MGEHTRYSLEETLGNYWKSTNNYYIQTMYKLSEDGEVLWEKELGLKSAIRSIDKTLDGGYVVINELDCVKTDGLGNIQWQTHVQRGDKPVGYKLETLPSGTSPSDELSSVKSTSDGNYILVGKLWMGSSESYNAWICKLDVNGKMLWEKSVGIFAGDEAKSCIETQDKNYIVQVETDYYYPANQKSWMRGAPAFIKFDNNGNIIWQKEYKEFNDDGPIFSTYDGGFFTLAGAGMVSQPLYMMRINTNGQVLWKKTYNQYKSGTYSYCREKPVIDWLYSGNSLS